MNKQLALDVYFHHEADKLHVGKCIYKNRQILFQYQQSFIETNIELSPFKLPLRPDVYIDQERTFAGLPGLLYDALPDGWGLLLMDRYFRQQGYGQSGITPLERLAFIGDRALGALSFEPSVDIDFKWQSNIGLDVLASHCEVILHGNESNVLTELVIAGGSPGGARPKVVVGFNEKNSQICSGVSDLKQGFVNYLIKFSSMTDANDIAEVEYAYSLMAKDCNIEMPNTRLFDAGKYGAAYGIERFDRIGNRKVHMHTLSGLLHANFRIPNLDYIDYLKTVLLLTQHEEAVMQAYRRMVFNVMTNNRDDHSKNFAFLYKNRQWQLSPAYDLTYSSGMAGEHTMTIAGEGANPTMDHFQQVAKKLSIDTEKASSIIRQVKSVIDEWLIYADKANVEKKIAKRFDKIFRNILT